MKLRKRLYKHEAELLGIKPKDDLPGRNQNSYRITESQWELINKNRITPKEREFVETQLKKNKDGEIISTIEKLQSEPIEVPENFELIKVSTSQTTGQQWLQYAPKKEDEAVREIDFEAIIKKYIKPIEVYPTVNVSGECLFDRAVYTDVHVGMNTNENGYSLYGGKWDEDEIMRRNTIFISHIIENQKSDTLIIDELGDFMDGWDGETVRKGHKLPQNMDNEKAFDVGLRFKISKIDALVKHYKKIICNNICEDNHAAAYGYVVNSAFKSVMDSRYTNVSVTNHRRFISHYTIGNRCFIITHGKDSKNLKFGFKPVLDAVQIEKIKNYIEHHKLYDYDIEFSKGDSHQFIFDNSTCDSFNYYNYPAFSPSSNWIQVNFHKGSSGFVTFNYKEKGEPTHHPYRFEWNNDREEKTIDWTQVSI